MIITSVWGNVGMFYHITLCNTGVAFSRQDSQSLVSVAMETNGAIPTLLHFLTDICFNISAQFWLNII